MGIISHVAALKERIDKQVVVKKARSGGARWRSLCDRFPSLPHRLPSQGRVFQKVFCLPSPFSTPRGPFGPGVFLYILHKKKKNFILLMIFSFFLDIN